MVNDIKYIDDYSGKTIFDEIKNYIKQYGLRATLIKAIRDLYPIIPLFLYHTIYDRYFNYEKSRIKYFIGINRVINSGDIRPYTIGFQCTHPNPGIPFEKNK